jgi:AcrR family transcriptional regulator
VLDIASAVFGEHGYAGTSLARVAERAGITKSAVLHHFESKEALYVAVLARFVGELGRLIVEARVNEGPFVERLDRLGVLIVDYLGTHPEAAKLLVSELIGQGPFARGPGADTVHHTLETVVEFLEAGMDAGAFRRQDATQLAMSITGMHLIYFAAHEITHGLTGDDPFSVELLERRRKAILECVRALCLP